MNLETYRRLVDSISYGKKLPGALYLFRPAEETVSPQFWQLVCRAEAAARPDPSWNLLKVHTDQVAFTFLTYPGFDTEPHPALAEATKINLNTGSIVRTDYRARANPPILHRKETFFLQTIHAYPNLQPSQAPRRKRDFTAIHRRSASASTGWRCSSD